MNTCPLSSITPAAGPYSLIYEAVCSLPVTPFVLCSALPIELFPLWVKPSEDGSMTLLAGFYRYRALILQHDPSNHDQVTPAIIHREAPRDQLLSLAVDEIIFSIHGILGQSSTKSRQALSLLSSLDKALRRQYSIDIPGLKVRNLREILHISGQSKLNSSRYSQLQTLLREG